MTLMAGNLSFLRYLQKIRDRYLLCYNKVLSNCLYLQVTLMGMGAFLGGMMTLTPECRHPLMAPPLASTMKLTRNLETERRLVRS